MSSSKLSAARDIRDSRRSPHSSLQPATAGAAPIARCSPQQQAQPPQLAAARDIRDSRRHSPTAHSRCHRPRQSRQQEAQPPQLNVAPPLPPPATVAKAGGAAPTAHRRCHTSPPLQSPSRDSRRSPHSSQPLPQLAAAATSERTARVRWIAAAESVFAQLTAAASAQCAHRRTRQSRQQVQPPQLTTVREEEEGDGLALQRVNSRSSPQLPQPATVSTAGAAPTAHG